MTVEAGEIIGYLGPNGAGKSTTIKMMTGVLEPSSGEIMVNGVIMTLRGHDIRDYATNEYRKKISAVFQDYNIYAGTIAENVLMSRLPHLTPYPSTN